MGRTGIEILRRRGRVLHRRMATVVEALEKRQLLSGLEAAAVGSGQAMLSAGAVVVTYGETAPLSARLTTSDGNIIIPLDVSALMMGVRDDTIHFALGG